jgi:hypothetical protein
MYVTKRLAQVKVDRSNENRVIFLDNLRYFFVLCVVLQHSVYAYNNMLWWPVAEGDSSIIVEWLAAFFDAFTMPLLFYVAGYFAIPTIQKKGVASFLKGKLTRLGIPWLVCSLTICPILPLIYHYTRNNLTLSESYGELWLTLMKNAGELNIGIIDSMNTLMQNNQFYQRYMWFLSLLLLFFVLFSVIYLLKKNWFEPADHPVTSTDPSILSTLKLLVIVGFLTSFFSFIMIGIMFFSIPKLANPEPLFSLGNVIQFRPSRIFLHIIYFGLGIITYKKKWIERGTFPGHFKTWIISFTILLIAFLYAHYLMLHGPENSKEIFSPIFFFILNFLTISTLGFFTSLAVRFWNRPTAVDRNLASNSYNMYLSHYIFVIVFQFILFTTPGIPELLKIAIVSTSSILCSYMISQFLIKPFPRISIAVAGGLFMVMALVIHP